MSVKPFIALLKIFRPEWHQTLVYFLKHLNYRIS